MAKCEVDGLPDVAAEQPAPQSQSPLDTLEAYFETAAWYAESGQAAA